MHPSLYINTKNPNIIINNINNNTGSKSIITSSENTQNNSGPKINNISNRLFNLSPSVRSCKDIECTKNDFNQESNDYINLGYLGKAIKVIHKKTNRLYSIKAIKKDKIIKIGLANHLKKYIDIMYKVDHCFFLRLLNHFEDDTNLYLIFQCINEVKILDKINLKILTKEKIFKYFKQILEALQFLHSRNIFFISLEPESIIIDNNDNIRLTDYAYSKVTVSETNIRNGYKGDYNTYINSYVAPELISYNKGILHKSRSKGSAYSDLWELGILLYEMITGNLLFNKTGMSIEEFYKNITTPVNKNNEILKKINDLDKEYNIIKDIILQLLEFNPKKRINLDKILKIQEIQEINYEKVIVDENERIINLKNANECWSPEEQLIHKLKKENEKLKNENLNLKSKIKELTKKNEELNFQNINYNKILNEEPNEDNIKKEVEFLSQIRTLKFNNQIVESSLNEQKNLNEILNNKISELELGYTQKNLKSDETISSLEKKIADLENKLFNPINNEYSKESLQYYLSLFNNNLEQFIQIVNTQNKKTDDSCINNLNNFMHQKQQEFNKKLNDFFNFIKNGENFDEKNKNILWLKKQIDELFPYKKKCLILNKEIIKLQTMNENLKNKYDIKDKIWKEKEEINNIKIKKLKNKIFHFFENCENISSNSENKKDEFIKIFNDIGFE